MLLIDFWPCKNNSTIVVISCYPELALTLVEHKYKIYTMTLLESTELLLKLLSLKYKGKDNSIAEQIYKLLDSLPLAITLVASLIWQTLQTLEETFEQL